MELLIISTVYFLYSFIGLKEMGGKNYKRCFAGMYWKISYYTLPGILCAFHLTLAVLYINPGISFSRVWEPSL